jgi:hypothetical protein
VCCALTLQEEESTGFIFRATVLVNVDAYVTGRVNKNPRTLRGVKRKKTTTVLKQRLKLRKLKPNVRLEVYTAVQLRIHVLRDVTPSPRVSEVPPERWEDVFGGLVVSMLTEAGRSRPKPLDFSGAVKILSMPSFGGEVK